MIAVQWVKIFGYKWSRLVWLRKFFLLCLQLLSHNGHCVIITADKEEKIFSTKPVCSTCSRIFLPIEPRSFSFNSPYGACSRCTGLGVTLEVDPDLVIPNEIGRAS